MADVNILQLTQSTEPEGAYLYVVINSQDYYISYDNFLKYFEESLGNPSANGKLLSSTIQGVRSWVDPETGATIVTKLEALTGNNRLSISAIKDSAPAVPSTTDNKAYVLFNGTWRELSQGELDTTELTNPDALPNLGTEEDATQAEINAAIDAIVENKVDKVTATEDNIWISDGDGGLKDSGYNIRLSLIE